MEQLQNEKRKALVEHEHAKLAQIDERLKAELREWKDQLVPRKQVRIFFGLKCSIFIDIITLNNKCNRI